MAAVRPKPLANVQKFKAIDKCISEARDEPRAPLCAYFDKVVPLPEGPEARRRGADSDSRAAAARRLQGSRDEAAAAQLAAQRRAGLREVGGDDERRRPLPREQGPHRPQGRGDASFADVLPVATDPAQPDGSHRRAKQRSWRARASTSRALSAGLQAARQSLSPPNAAHPQKGPPVATGAAARVLDASLPWPVRGLASTAEVASGGAELGAVTSVQDWEEPWQQTRTQLVSMSDTAMRQNKNLYQSGHRAVRASAVFPAALCCKRHAIPTHIQCLVTF